jgi:hypothetical protein
MDYPVVTVKRLKELLKYNKETGVFTWKHRRNQLAICGSVAGSLSKNGYVRIKIDGKRYMAHRLAILYTSGYFPETFVDHINRCRADNKYSNLREASASCQAKNRKVRVDNISGVTGVHWNAKKSRWFAIITDAGASYTIGSFRSMIDATYHRFAAEQCMGFLDCDKNSSAKKLIDTHICLEYWTTI